MAKTQLRVECSNRGAMSAPLAIMDTRTVFIIIFRKPYSALEPQLSWTLPQASLEPLRLIFSCMFLLISYPFLRQVDHPGCVLPMARTRASTWSFLRPQHPGGGTPSHLVAFLQGVGPAHVKGWRNALSPGTAEPPGKRHRCGPGQRWGQESNLPQYRR